MFLHEFNTSCDSRGGLRMRQAITTILYLFLLPTVADAAESEPFRKQIQPLLKTYCVRCHNADEAESGVPVGQLDGSLNDRYLRLWNGIRKQIADKAMPPEDEPQPSMKQRMAPGACPDTLADLVFVGRML
jgi:hypothetical protein